MLTSLCFISTAPRRQVASQGGQEIKDFRGAEAHTQGQADKVGRDVLGQKKKCASADTKLSQGTERRKGGRSARKGP